MKTSNKATFPPHLSPEQTPLIGLDIPMPPAAPSYGDPMNRRPELAYIIKSGEYVKIGITKDIRRRLETLQIGNPIKLEVIGLIPGGWEMEREMQGRFGACHVRGEWFLLTKEIQAYIDSELVPLNGEALDHIATHRAELARQAYVLMEATP